MEKPNTDKKLIDQCWIEAHKISNKKHFSESYYDEKRAKDGPFWVC